MSSLSTFQHLTIYGFVLGFGFALILPKNWSLIACVIFFGAELFRCALPIVDNYDLLRLIIVISLLGVGWKIGLDVRKKWKDGRPS